MIERVASYRIESVVGTGTVGTVYRAVDEESEDVVAIKVLLPTVSHDEAIRARFRREVSIVRRLDHKNIVRFLATGDHEGQLYYAMEFVDGGSLKTMLSQWGRLNAEETVELGWQVCSALQYLHNHGVVHRDVKPANLFFDSRDHLLKLGDFGIALDTTLENITASGMTVGSYFYMSPEQIRGDAGIDSQADLYALGCLLYEMLAGRPPFQAETFPQLFEMHLKESPTPLRKIDPEIPLALAEIVLDLLKKDPHQRPLSAREVQGRLATVVLPKWERVEEDRRTEKLGTPNHRRRVLAGLLDTEPSTTDISWLRLGILFSAIVLLIVLAAVFR